MHDVEHGENIIEEVWAMLRDGDEEKDGNLFEQGEEDEEEGGELAGEH